MLHLNIRIHGYMVKCDEAIYWILEGTSWIYNIINYFQWILVLRGCQRNVCILFHALTSS